MSNNSKSFIYGMAKAIGKKQEADVKLKNEIMKLRLQAKLKRIEKAAAQKEAMAKYAAQEQLKNPQKYTPEQQYLRRRFQEENPIAAMSIPEEGQNIQETGISYPKNEVAQDTSGSLAVKPISQERQAELLISKVQQMQSEGRRVHPVVLKIVEKMKENLSRKQYLNDNKEEINQMQKRLKAINIQLSYTDTKELRDQRDALKSRLANILGIDSGGQQPTSDDGHIDDDISDEEKAFRSVGGGGYGDDEYSGKDNFLDSSELARQNKLNDPIAQRIQELKGQYTDEQIADFLSEKGIDPTKYGL